MVKEATIYICEICGIEYKARADAQNCQDRGFLNPKILSGTLFKYDPGEDGFLAMLFLNKLIGPKEREYQGHFPCYNILSVEFDDIFLKQNSHCVADELEVFDDLDNLEELCQDEFSFAKGVFSYIDYSQYHIIKPKKFMKGLEFQILSADNDLNRLLELAVHEERYEEAARIRDKIRALKVTG